MISTRASMCKNYFYEFTVLLQQVVAVKLIIKKVSETSIQCRSSEDNRNKRVLIQLPTRNKEGEVLYIYRRLREQT